MGPGRHLVTYPLRGGTLRNIVAVEERSRWAEESWSLRDRSDGPAPRLRGLLAPRPRLAGPDRGCLPLGPLPPPGRAATGTARARAILGDAAHPTLPFLAQGANMALEDAWVLAHSLATP